MPIEPLGEAGRGPTPHAYPWAMPIEASVPLLPPSLFSSLQRRPSATCATADTRGDVATVSRWAMLADAVRFSVISHSDGHVRMIYVLEKNHAPGGHGVLEFPIDASPSAETQILTRQACAFFESYLKKSVAAEERGSTPIKPRPKN